MKHGITGLKARTFDFVRNLRFVIKCYIIGRLQSGVVFSNSVLRRQVFFHRGSLWLRKGSHEMLVDCIQKCIDQWLSVIQAVASNGFRPTGTEANVTRCRNCSLLDILVYKHDFLRIQSFSTFMGNSTHFSSGYFVHFCCPGSHNDQTRATENFSYLNSKWQVTDPDHPWAYEHYTGATNKNAQHWSLT